MSEANLISAAWMLSRSTALSYEQALEQLAPVADQYAPRPERQGQSDREVLAQRLFEWNSPTDPYFVIRGRAGDVDSEGDPYLPIIDAVLDMLGAEIQTPSPDACDHEFYDQCATCGVSAVEWFNREGA